MVGDESKEDGKSRANSRQLFRLNMKVGIKKIGVSETILEKDGTIIHY